MKQMMNVLLHTYIFQLIQPWSDTTNDSYQAKWFRDHI